MKKVFAVIMALSMLACLGVPALAAADAPLVGMANPWTSAAPDQIEAVTGLSLVIPEGADAACSYMENLAQASWSDGGVSVTERVSFCETAPAMDTDALTALSGVYFTGMNTQSKELIVGGRCPGYMEFCRGSYGAMLWYDADAGLVYTLSFDKTADPKYLGDTAETNSVPRASGSSHLRS